MLSLGENSFKLTPIREGRGGEGRSCCSSLALPQTRGAQHLANQVGALSSCSIPLLIWLSLWEAWVSFPAS